MNTRKPKPSKTLLIAFRNGKAIAVYDDCLLPILQQGDSTIKRASNVEPETDGWSADLSPVKGPKMRGFSTRAAALAAEVKWLNKNIISETKKTKGTKRINSTS